MDLFSDFIYHNTPLKTAMTKTFEIINKDLNDTIKFIIILSDGISTDGDPNDLKYLLKEKNTYIITFYFSSYKVYNPKQLYYIKPDGNKGLEQLYNLASEMPPYSPIFDMLEKRGWKIDYTKRNKLFVKANNIEIFEEFIDVINSFINGKNNLLGEIISKIKLNDYINFYNKKHRIKKNQKNLDICWSHALAKVIEYASHRIYRGKYLDKYPYPVFNDIKNYLIREYNTEGKNDIEMTNILDKILPKYFLRYSSYDTKSEKNLEHKVKTALMRGRPLVLTFKLFEKQWKNFRNFFKKNKKGILTKELINLDMKKDIKKDNFYGHAVIIIEYNEDGYVCLNSWGKNFADKGQFRIKNLDVLDNGYFRINNSYFSLVPFVIDVYFNKNDLPLELKNAWNEYNQKNEKQFKDNYFE